MSGFQARPIETVQQMELALGIRRLVFIDEQGVPEEEEIDRFDGDPRTVTDAVHVLVSRAVEPVATGRLLLDHPPEERAHVGRVAVLASERRTGAGRAVMDWLAGRARELGRPGITLAAQEHAIGFYERLGYRARGPIFLDAGIDHRWMDLDF